MQKWKYENTALPMLPKKNIQLSDAAENMMVKSLQTLPAKMGYSGTLRYFTGITQKEKELAVKLVGTRLYCA